MCLYFSPVREREKVRELGCMQEQVGCHHSSNKNSHHTRKKQNMWFCLIFINLKKQLLHSLTLTATSTWEELLSPLVGSNCLQRFPVRAIHFFFLKSMIVAFVLLMLLLVIVYSSFDIIASISLLYFFPSSLFVLFRECAGGLEVLLLLFLSPAFTF